MQLTDTFQAIDRNLFRRSLKLMGNRFDISVEARNRAVAEELIELAVSEIRRIEKLLTTFDENSLTNQVNEMAGIAPVIVNEELFQLVQRAQRISVLTQGAFDLSYGSIDKRLWNFDTSLKELPDRDTAKEMVRLISYHNIILDDVAGTIFLKEKGMRIGFGGIGKGYAADSAKRVLADAGVTSGIVNASGDLTTWGNQPNGNPWTIGIADPDSAGNPFSYINITDMSVATSGNYEKFITIGGKRYSHTIDPRTGYPVTGIKSVTIISPIAELADAMATPVMVMGIKVGLDLINQMNQMACIIIDEQQKVYTSKNITVI
ncbi:FAD:protein FMN transferase [Flavihumibacter sp. ZG627]|uniref:FAD:protein FMN transferase n=1 Tax=Flavihumibacter sp. ZG627 TaxID=1463156 RepID=UPI000AC9A223|nr:FAD:protein FMN transferase [Flavihumibacter sp. ZG627]